MSGTIKTTKYSWDMLILSLCKAREKIQSFGRIVNNTKIIYNFVCIPHLFLKILHCCYFNYSLTPTFSVGQYIITPSLDLSLFCFDIMKDKGCVLKGYNVKKKIYS